MNLDLSAEDKVVLYSGNLGEKQGLENIIEAAAHFRDDVSVKFVIVGSGGSEFKLKEMANNANFKKYIFPPFGLLRKITGPAGDG